MPRVTEVPDPADGSELAALYERDRQVFGDVLNPTKVMAHCPPILQAARLLSASIDQSGRLPRTMPPLIYLRVATINGCPF